MSLASLDHKQAYYYVICVIAFFVLMWGVIDFTSASLGLLSVKSPTAKVSVPATPRTLEEAANFDSEKGDQVFESFYQKKMLSDRLLDSLARVVVSGLIFTYTRLKAAKLEEKA